MMTKEQYLLTKLAEECAEVVQMAIKCQHFGLDECQTEGSESNRQRLHQEISDLLSIVVMLNEQTNFGFVYTDQDIDEKIKKVEKYAQYSKLLRLVDWG